MRSQTFVRMKYNNEHVGTSTLENGSCRDTNSNSKRVLGAFIFDLLCDGAEMGLDREEEEL